MKIIFERNAPSRLKSGFLSLKRKYFVVKLPFHLCAFQFCRQIPAIHLDLCFTEPQNVLGKNSAVDILVDSLWLSSFTLKNPVLSPS